MRDNLRMLFGFCLLVAITAIALAITLGKVEEKTSYGLGMILGSLTSLAGGFANWAFGDKGKFNEEQKYALSAKPEVDAKPEVEQKSNEEP